MSTTTLVIPCYNEADRLDVTAFERFAQTGAANLLLVNDGSRDATLSVLRNIAATAPNRVAVMDVAPNAGKAEAVRRGMLDAVAQGADYVGFWDADLATPLSELPSFIAQLNATPRLVAVIGSRVRLLGRTVQRHASRHYSGRVFATAASIVLQLPVYDTQCGAKLFRVTPQLKRALATPFVSRWVFDVELLARLGRRDQDYSPTSLLGAVYEHPLTEWRDVTGSKLRARDFARSALDLFEIYWTHVRRRSTTPADTPRSRLDLGKRRSSTPQHYQSHS